MDHVTSADGTSIAVHTTGEGDPVVVIGGAFSTAKDAAQIADALAGRGLRAVTYDRRARGDSGDSGDPYSFDPQREVDDLAAVVEWAAAGSAARPAVLGHSSGAVLALLAASRGVAVRHLFLSEPPFHFGEHDPAADFVDRLQTAVDEERGADAVVLFQREGVGLPDEMIEQIRQSPMFDALIPLAQSTVYDAILTRDVSTPTSQMLDGDAPVTILCGAQTFPLLSGASRRLADAMPAAELLIMPESVMHRLDPDAAARVVGERLF